jgi:hypothetical protein
MVGVDLRNLQELRGSRFGNGTSVGGR